MVSNISTFITQGDRYLSVIELMEAMQKKDYQLARQLIKKPMNVNVLDGRNVSALMIAAYRGYADICENLLRLGAAVSTEITEREEATDSDYLNLWQRAKISGDQPTIDVIDKAYVTANWNITKDLSNTNPQRFQTDGLYQFNEAARLGMTTLCVDIVCSGVEVNHQDLKNLSNSEVDSAISAAYLNGHKTTCFVLLALGADISPLRAHEDFTKEIESSLIILRNYFDSCSTSNSCI